MAKVMKPAKMTVVFVRKPNTHKEDCCMVCGSEREARELADYIKQFTAYEVELIAEDTMRILPDKPQ